MATYGPIVCTNPTVVVFFPFYLCFSLSLSPFYNNAHRWQIYARQLWVLSSQLTTLDDYHSPPSPSALYVAVFPVCSRSLPRADPVFLLSYLAASEVQHCTGSHPHCFAKRSPQCALHNNREQLRTAVCRGEGDASAPASVKTVSFIKCERVCVTLGRISPPGHHRRRVREWEGAAAPTGRCYLLPSARA